MNKGRVGEERGGKETDGCPLTVTLEFTSLSCIRLLVVTTNYTLVLYLCRGEGYLWEWGGNSLLIYVLRTMGGLRTMGKISIVLNNGQSTMERVPMVLDNRPKEQCSALIWGTMAINSRQ
jgi:hypothetical protein